MQAPIVLGRIVRIWQQMWEKSAEACSPKGSPLKLKISSHVKPRQKTILGSKSKIYTGNQLIVILSDNLVSILSLWSINFKIVWDSLGKLKSNEEQQGNPKMGTRQRKSIGE